MCRQLLVVAFVFTSASAMRVQPARVGATKEAATTRVEEKPIDVTSLLDTAEFKKSGYDCCCDKRKEGDAGKADDDRGIDSATRANYCAIAYTWPLGKCGNVKVTPGTKMAHNYKSTPGGTCEVMRDNVPVLVEALKKPDYCPKNEHTMVADEGTITIDIPAAAFKKTSTATCPDGSEGKVTCQVGTPKVGYWSAVECGGKPTFCPGTVDSDDGAPGLHAGMLDEEHYVDCYQTTPSTGTAKCAANGWIPQGGESGWDADGLPPVCLKSE